MTISFFTKIVPHGLWKQCFYCHSHNNWGPWNSFQRLLVPVYYWKSVKKPETDPQYYENGSIETEDPDSCNNTLICTLMAVPFFLVHKNVFVNFCTETLRTDLEPEHSGPRIGIGLFWIEIRVFRIEVRVFCSGGKKSQFSCKWDSVLLPISK